MMKLLTLCCVAGTILVSCHSGNGKEQAAETGTSQNKTVAVAPVQVDAESNALLETLRKNGDYVNSRSFPSLIKSSIVHDSLNTNIKIIDIRPEKAYKEGHIPGAVHVAFADLPEYFTSGIKPFTFDRIIVVSENGQLSAYTVCLLRLMGYGNVYSMRWGMSAWNEDYAKQGWLAGCSSAYEGDLETKVNPTPPATSLPGLHTGKSSGEDILMARMQALFSENLDSIIISADQVFAAPEKYFVVNYDRRDKYESGHIPGAVRYKPGSTLGFVQVMGTIPSDKPVVVYCGTGHNSAFVTAYLRLFGYNAHTLQFGNNGFMHQKMIEDRSTLSWLPFSDEEVNNYAVVK